MQIIFKITKNHPEYRYNVNDQLIRSGLSIGSNISEGNQRRGKDRNHFFNIALGSLEECRFQLSMFNDEINKEEVDDILDKIRATTINLSKSQSHSSS
jgi:four helix bundle protein